MTTQTLALLRCLLLAPAVCAWFLLYDVLQRIAIASGEQMARE